MNVLSSEEALANALFHHSLSMDRVSPTEVAEDIVGLHNTSQITPYLSMRPRLPGFSRGILDREMWDEWSLARLRTMRGTMFILPHALLEVAAAATRHFLEPFAERWLRDSGLTKHDFDRLAGSIESALEEGPMTVRALRKALEVDVSIDLPGVVGRMCDMGVLVGGKPPRSWRSTIRQYHRWCEVLPDVDLHRWNEDNAAVELIDRYIRSYGPVTLNDMSWWSGIAKGRCSEALAKLSAIEEVSVDGWDGPLYRQTECTHEVVDSAVLALPLLDPYVQGYRDRTRFLDPKRHVFVYDGGGNSAATLIHGGHIIGVWQVSEEPVHSIRYHLFNRVPATIRRAAEADLESVGNLYFDRPVEVINIPTMKPLSAGGGRSAMHPLDERIHRASRRQPAAK